MIAGRLLDANAFTRIVSTAGPVSDRPPEFATDDRIGRCQILSEPEIRAAIAMPEAVAAVEARLCSLVERARSAAALHSSRALPQADGEVHVKGAYIEGAPWYFCKVASGFYRNPTRGLPTSAGLFLAFDAVTGQPATLLLDNGFLTALRTVAAGAVAAKYLARERLNKVAVIGAGSQARWQLRALAVIRQRRSSSGSASVHRVDVHRPAPRVVRVSLPARMHPAEHCVAPRRLRANDPSVPSGSARDLESPQPGGMSGGDKGCRRLRTFSSSFAVPASPPVTMGAPASRSSFSTEAPRCPTTSNQSRRC